MKNIKARWLLPAMVLLLTACSKMDDTYRQFLDGGEIIYTGKVDFLEVFPGKNRVLLSWYLVSDPKITMCRVYWNQRRDSTEVAVKRTGGTDTIRLILDKLPENIYTFQVYTYDNAGHSSVKEEAIGNAYGDAYISTLSNRPVRAAKYDAAKNEATIWWFGVNNQVQYVEVLYTNSAGMETKVVQRADSVPENPRDPLEFRASLKLPDYKAGTSFRFRTAYKPVKIAIDTFYTAYETRAVQ
ncbi:DUF4998 domain-containing protein [Chitinophaga oryzae]|uniref:DUF4998 domain-containing protein n=1 Tax=Chitinophaga oryzae TaxID=2725414 RepID=A0ABX6LIN3_9BACT|nr:DUF4998 domain-containing protein [Chitinophaga oryzae]QJB39989.1 DUF4998 domain-containing protein [Chitinophaga oryzae]